MGDRLLGAVRKGLCGGEPQVSFGWGGACPVRTGKRRRQRTASSRSHMMGFSDRRSDAKGLWGKIRLGLNGLLKESVAILRAMTSGRKAQILKENDLI